MSNVYPKSYANQANWASKQGQQMSRNTSSKNVTGSKGTRDSIKTTIHKRDAFRPSSEVTYASPNDKKLIHVQKSGNNQLHNYNT